MQIAVLIIKILTPWLFKKKCETILGVIADIDLVKSVGYEAPSKEHRDTQSSFWIFVRHHCFIKYILNEWHGKCTYKECTEGPSCLPGCHVDCWAPQVSIVLTVSQTKYIRVHSRILLRKNSMKNLVVWIICSGYKMLINNLIAIPKSRPCERYWIQVWCGRFFQWAPTAEEALCGYYRLFSFKHAPVSLCVATKFDEVTIFF